MNDWLIDLFYNFTIKQIYLFYNFNIEQVNLFNYLGNVISYEGEMDIDNKLNNFFKITGILNNVFRSQKTLKKTRIKLYNTLALPVLLYGSETWTINLLAPKLFF